MLSTEQTSQNDVICLENVHLESETPMCLLTNFVIFPSPTRSGFFTKFSCRFCDTFISQGEVCIFIIPSDRTKTLFSRPRRTFNWSKIGLRPTQRPSTPRRWLNRPSEVSVINVNNLLIVSKAPQNLIGFQNNTAVHWKYGLRAAMSCGVSSEDGRRQCNSEEEQIPSLMTSANERQKFALIIKNKMPIQTQRTDGVTKASAFTDLSWRSRQTCSMNR